MLLSDPEKMNEQYNPFTDPVAAQKRANAQMGLWIAGLVVIGIVAGGLAWMAFRRQTQNIDRLQRELDEVRGVASRSQAEAAELRQSLTNSQSRLADLGEKLSNSQSRITNLEKEKETVTQTHKGLEEEMRAQLESRDVTISQLQGKLTVNILDRILFDSGEAVLKSAGEAVLRKIAAIIEQHPTLKIHVIGHTDNVPIRASARSRFTSNWELSTARALAAVRFLTENAGVDPRRVGAVGYGEFRPLADNATAEGRAKNRRIAITILPDELAGVDIGPAVKTNLPPKPLPGRPDPANALPDEP